MWRIFLGEKMLALSVEKPPGFFEGTEIRLVGTSYFPRLRKSENLSANPADAHS
jgi:hypothetical protein